MPPEATQLDDHELELNSTDQANFPYIKMRGNLIWDGSAWVKWSGIPLNSLIPEAYDNIAITYVAAGNGTGEIETVVYKVAAATVATLTLAYNASNKLITIIRT